MSYIIKGSQRADYIYISTYLTIFNISSGASIIAYGYSGNDFLFGTKYSDILYGNTGHDTLYGYGGQDSLYGGSGNDKLYGGKHNDSLYGQNGQDILLGQHGNDALYGGNHHDRLYGGDGHDRLYGGRGADRLYGNNGSDRLYGGNGADRLYGNKGSDKLYGGSGADLLSGGNGSDKLYGGRGADRLYGNKGSDKLYGGAGNDTLDGGKGVDKVYAGGGDDQLLFNVDQNNSLANDYYDGGSGSDTLNLVMDTSIIDDDFGKVIYKFIHADKNELFDFYDVSGFIRLSVINIEHITINGKHLIDTGSAYVLPDIVEFVYDNDSVISGDVTGTVYEDDVLVVTGRLSIDDIDNDDTPVFNSTNATGDYGEFVFDGDTNTWQYTLDNIKAQPLKDTVQEVFHVTSSDGKTQTITIDVEGTNDESNISGDITGSVVEDDTLSAGGTLTITDVDSDDTPIFNSSQATGLYGDFVFDGSTNTWEYTLDNLKAQVLKGLNAVQEVFIITSSDNKAQAITVDVSGVDDDSVISGDINGNVAEDGNLVATGVLTIEDKDANDTPAFINTTNQGNYGELNLKSNTWVYTLDNVKAQALKGSTQETFDVTTTDGKTETLTINITGQNDDSVISGDIIGRVSEDGVLVARGNLAIEDADSDDTPLFNSTNATGDYGEFDFDSTTNTWEYTLDNAKAQTLKDTVQEVFYVTSSDGRTQTITIDVEGTNDESNISGDITGSVAEDDTLSARGTLSITDIDSDDTPIFNSSQATGLYGDFAFDGSTNTWEYTLDNDKAQELKGLNAAKEVFIITSSDNKAQAITVDVSGADDVSVISGDIEGDVAEDGSLVATGFLNVIDVDAVDTPAFINTTIQGSYGDLNLKNNTWVYILDNAKAQALKGTTTETFDVTTTDGKTETLTINITGQNDDSVISGDIRGYVIEDEGQSTNGTLTVNDADNDDSPSFIAGSQQGSYGDFSLQKNSVSGEWVWSYTLNAEAQSLKGAATEVFNVSTTDGQSQTITIDVIGGDNGSVISGTVTGSVYEDGVDKANGTLIITDTDSVDSPTFISTQATGLYGDFYFDGSTKTWEYHLDNTKAQGLKDSDVVEEIFVITTSDHQAQIITVNVQGADDDSVISGDIEGDVFEDGNLVTTGVLSIDDKDIDDMPAFINTTIQGNYGELTLKSNTWVYILDNGKAQALKGTTTETFDVTTTDGKTETLTINITGQNDDSVISGDIIGRVSEDGVLVARGNLAIEDADSDDTPLFNSTNATGDYGEFDFDSTTNTWEYTLDNAKAQLLKDTVQEVFYVTSSDGKTQTITIDVEGTNDESNISGDITGSVAEDDTLSARGTLTITDVDSSDTPTFNSSQATGLYGDFVFDGSTNTWEYTLDNLKAQELKGLSVVQEVFIITSIDNKAQAITIDVSGADDASVISGDIEGDVAEDGNLVATGVLSVTDIDAVDTPAFINTTIQGNYGELTLKSNTWVYILDNTKAQALKGTTTETFDVTTTDGKTETLTINITGQNDDSVISGEIIGRVSEDNVLVATGNLVIEDADSDDTPVFNSTNVIGDYGEFDFDSTTNTWQYILDNTKAQVLKDSVQEVFYVTSSDGKTQTITIDIEGRDDTSVIAGTTTGSVDVVGSQVFEGVLNITDVDKDDTPRFVDTNLMGAYGDFVLRGNTWTYTLDSIKVRDLNGTAQEVFTVVSSDGNAQEITIDVYNDINAELSVAGSKYLAPSPINTTSLLHQVITEDIVKINPSGLSTQNVTITLESLPQFGYFTLLTGTEVKVLNVGDSFDRDDLVNNRVTYNHHESKYGYSLAQFSVTDNTTSITLVIDIAASHSFNKDIIAGFTTNDTFVTRSEGGHYQGGLGDDTFIPTQGVEIFDGGDGIDSIYFDPSEGPYLFHLGTGKTSHGGDAEGDILSNIENINGSYFDDIFYMDPHYNSPYNYSKIILNGGFDTISYEYATSEIWFQIPGAQKKYILSYENGGWSDGENLKAALGDYFFHSVAVDLPPVNYILQPHGTVDKVIGSKHWDIIFGNEKSDVIDSSDGNDTINGFDGEDILIAGDGDDYVYGNVEWLFSWRHTRHDSDILFGGNGDDRLFGFGGDDYIIPGLGADYIEGDMDWVEVDPGIDTVDFSDSWAGVTADLEEETAFGGEAELRVRGDRTAPERIFGIEIIIGSNYDDTLYGNNEYNQLLGGKGNDYIDGRGGSDILDGGDDIDTLSYASSSVAVSVNLSNGVNDSGDTITNFENLIGSNLADTLIGDDGDNIIDGRGGIDDLQGGAGNDTVDYSSATVGVKVSLPSQTVLSNDGNNTPLDTISGFENVIGSNFADDITGDDNDNVIEGRDDHDILRGGLGNDTVSYAHSNVGVDIDLNTQTAKSKVDDSILDTISGFENVIGSNQVDTLKGDAGDNIIDGRGGVDDLQGGAGNDTLDYSFANIGVKVDLHHQTSVSNDGNNTAVDTISGFENVIGSDKDDVLIASLDANHLSAGAGMDTLSYVHSNAAVTVDLTKNTGLGGFAEGDTIAGVENLIGSGLNDILKGDSGNNVIDGGGGDDNLDGDAGVDTLSYASSSVGVSVNLLDGSNNSNDIIANFENLLGSSLNDILKGNNSNNVIDGGGGNDNLDGGAGVDTLSYASSSVGVSVNLLDGSNDSDDILANFENIMGSAFADTLTGDAGDNVIDGGEGQDVLDGGEGVDTLDYSKSSVGAKIDLREQTSYINDGNNQTLDTISGFENVIGSANVDAIIGDERDNFIDGGDGIDFLRGGFGIDTLSYASSSEGVKVNLTQQVAYTNDGLDHIVDAISDFENLIGSHHNDALSGTASANVINGLAGDDTIYAGAGDDVIDGGLGKNSLHGEDGNDTINIMTLNELITGGAGIDTLNITTSSFITAENKDEIKGVLQQLYKELFDANTLGADNVAGTALVTQDASSTLDAVNLEVNGIEALQLDGDLMESELEVSTYIDDLFV